MSETTEIVLLPPKETALQVYSTPMGLDPFLAQIKAELDAFVPDVTTKKGRERDKAHKAAINRAALEAFVQGGMTEECAKLAVALIAKKSIPAVSIAY